MPLPDRTRAAVLPLAVLAALCTFPAWAPLLFMALRSSAWAQGVFAFLVIAGVLLVATRPARPLRLPPSPEVVAEEIRRTKP